MSKGSERITVVVADDHPVFRQGIVRALTSTGRIDVVAEVADGRAALAAIRDLQPAVAVIDFRMPELDGPQVAHAVERDGLPTKVVVLSAYDDGSLVYQAVEAGAAGYLTKEADPDEIVDAVTRCARGDGYLAHQLAASLATEVKKRAKGDGPQLTDRELEVVRMIADGLSIPQIAAALHLGASTVKTHVQNLYEKLGVSDRGSAVAEAMRRRLVE